jgi:hypothetical protein
MCFNRSFKVEAFNHVLITLLSTIARDSASVVGCFINLLANILSIHSCHHIRPILGFEETHIALVVFKITMNNEGTDQNNNLMQNW